MLAWSAEVVARQRRAREASRRGALGKQKSTPCCQVVYARQCGWMLFAQHHLTQPKLFGSDHGLRFISGP
jgi:hypothetical protein